MDVYFCGTYYHTLIALIKALKNKSHPDIVLWNDIPEYDNLQSSLERSGAFNRFFYYDVALFNKKYRYKNDLQRIFFDKKLIKRAIPHVLSLDVSSLGSYSNIYFFNDVTPPARYCIYYYVKYHLIEDALDYFTYFDKYWNVNQAAFSEKGIRKKIKNTLGIGCTSWGQSKACIDIEVNDDMNIKIPDKKVVVCPRKNLFSSLSELEKNIIYAVFVGNSEIKVAKGKNMILLTQPLFADKFVDNLEKQLLVFECVVKEYCENDYQVFIKPHPRDEADYSLIIQLYNCVYIDKNIPSEMLNFDKDAYFDVAVSITSTAINFLDNVKAKRFMTRQYIDNCLSEA